MSIPQPQPPHQSRPPPSSSRPGTPRGPEGSGGPEEEEEKAPLIDEILRLERSMNGALRASRDEMESLKDSAAEKRAAIKRLEEQLVAVMQQMGTNNSDGASSSGKSPEPRRLQRRHSSGLSVCSTRSTWSSSSKVSTATGGRPDRRASMKRETSLRRSFLQQNVFSRRVSVTGDSPFFRRPTLQDAEIERKENSRRRSDPPAAQPAGALRRSTSFTSSRVGEEGSRASGNNSGGHLRRTLSTDDPESQSSDGSEDGKPGSVNEEELKRLRKTLRGKEGELDALRRRHQSNQNQLSYLQTKLHSIETKTITRQEEHEATVEALQRRKEVLVRDIRRKKRLTVEVERCVGEHNSRIFGLEQEIESKKLVLRKRQDKQIESETNDEGTKSTASLMKEEVRKHHLRLRVHSQYTAKAIESFLKCLESAKEKDVDGLLLGLDNSWHAGDADEEEEARRQRLVEEIALGVDTQLNNLDRTIKEIGGKVEEYKVLSSSEQLAKACERDVNSHGANNNDVSASSRQPNQLLSLTKECSDLLKDLISAISRTMESTVRATPHSLSIEFQPSESDARISENATSPSNATENAPPSNTSMSSNAERTGLVYDAESRNGNEEEAIGELSGRILACPRHASRSSKLRE